MSYQQNSFLSLNNFNQLYNNIKDIIQSRDSYNIDESRQYKKILKKLVLSINNKNPNEQNIQTLNNIAINKCVPFLIDIIHKDDKSMKAYNNQNENIIPESFKEIDNINTSESNDDFMKRFSEIEKERNMQIQQEINKNKSSEITVNHTENINNKQNELKNEIKPFEENIEGTSNIGSFFTTLDSTDDLNNSNNLDTNNNLDTSNNFETDYESIKQNIYKNFNKKMSDRETNNDTRDTNMDTRDTNIDTPKIINNIETNSSINQQQHINNQQQQINIDKTINTTFLIDTGTSDNSYVKNLNNKYWSKFTCSPNKTIEINKKCKVFLENITITGIENLNTSNIFIKINEIIIENISNNNTITNIINIPNTSQNGILNIQTNKFIGYVDENIKQLTITIINQDFKSIEDGNFVFLGSNMKNRIIMELRIQS